MSYVLLINLVINCSISFGRSVTRSGLRVRCRSRYLMEYESRSPDGHVAVRGSGDVNVPHVF